MYGLSMYQQILYSGLRLDVLWQQGRRQSDWRRQCYHNHPRNSLQSLHYFLQSSQIVNWMNWTTTTKKKKTLSQLKWIYLLDSPPLKGDNFSDFLIALLITKLFFEMRSSE